MFKCKTKFHFKLAIKCSFAKKLMTTSIYILTGILGLISLFVSLKREQAWIGVIALILAGVTIYLQVRVDDNNTNEQKAKDNQIKDINQKADSINKTVSLLRKDRTTDSTNYVEFFKELKAEYRLTRDSTTNKVQTVNTYITNARDVYIGDR